MGEGVCEDDETDLHLELNVYDRVAVEDVVRRAVTKWGKVYTPPENVDLEVQEKEGEGELPWFAAEEEEEEVEEEEEEEEEDIDKEDAPAPAPTEGHVGKFYACQRSRSQLTPPPHSARC